MPDLSRDLRRSLEGTIRSARTAAEVGATEALRRLGVAAAELPSRLESRRIERNRLRAHARSLGDRLNKDGTQDTTHLTEAAAYVQWHRLLFARFLLERNLLRDEAGIVISLADCREEAAMASGGDEWSVAAAHAARLLPGVFPPDDPLEALTLAPEHAKALRDHLKCLDPAIFAADDSLGWTYQFWRAAEQDQVRADAAKGRKVGAEELPAMTQFFTEPYMVRFLLHNALGAWWAGRVLSADPALARTAPNEDALRAACALPGYSWDYLRFVKDGGTWRPAAGTFPGWPRLAIELTVLDPCCGSGHFLTEALRALAALRMEDDKAALATPAQAVAAVLRDNIAGLEIDGRCVQIASFALALTAWKVGGPQTLPNPNVAWVGAPPPLPKDQFGALANGDTELRRGLAALHDLFEEAPLLGSLIEPVGGDLVDPVRVARIEESIATLVERVREVEPDRAEGAIAARGMADAAAMLARRWTLQSTNVPFLAAPKMASGLSRFASAKFSLGKHDLATAFLVAMLRRAAAGGAVALVSPQNWYQLGSYARLREYLLKEKTVRVVCDLGPAAFHDMNWWAARTALTIIDDSAPPPDATSAALDASHGREPGIKNGTVKTGPIENLAQASLVANPDFRISLVDLRAGPLLGRFALSGKGRYLLAIAPIIIAAFGNCPIWTVSGCVGSILRTQVILGPVAALFCGFP